MAYTNINDPSAYFQIATYTGNGSTQSITNDGNSDLQPDWVWVKNRGATNGLGYQHQAYDSSRGTTKKLLVSATNAEATDANSLTAFNSDGFSAGSNVGINENAVSHVAWQWKANGGTTSTNTDGSVTSTVQVNQDAGFSIVTWTVGLTSGNHSVGHGLGVKPAMFITKSRGSTSSWWTWHQGLTGDTSYVNLQTNNGELTYSDIWGDGITSSVFGYNYPATVYVQPYVAYCFAEKQGFSKFGSYVGNGNANGPFIYTGFKPAWIMVKNIDSGIDHWHIIDNKRSPNNVVGELLFADLTSAEITYTTEVLFDIVSNGFKLRGNYDHINKSGENIIYMAFAENPFTTSTGVPCTAR